MSSTRKSKRFLEIIAGAMQEGKSYYTDQKANEYVRTGKGFVLVYNCGKPEDFKDFTQIEILEKGETVAHLTSHHNSIIRSAKERKFSKRQIDLLNDNKRNEISLYKENAVPLFFRDCRTDNFYRIESLMNFAMSSKGNRRVKMQRPSREFELRFFDIIYKNVSHCYLIVDDCRAIYKNGLQSGDIQTYSRLNHSGTKIQAPELNGKGIDCSLIFHDLDLVNEEFYTYATEVTLFKCNQKPDFRKIRMPNLVKHIDNAFSHLQTAERYTRIKIQISPLDYNSSDYTIKSLIFRPTK
jgi:hypothetical protein